MLPRTLGEVGWPGSQLACRPQSWRRRAAAVVGQADRGTLSLLGAHQLPCPTALLGTENLSGDHVAVL